MSRTVTRLFDNYADAEQAVTQLERLGVPHRDISLVANNSDKAHDHRGHHKGDDAADGTGKGATTGGLLGGGAGLLAGLGMLAVPGLGPVVAAGWLASTALGAAVGAVAGGAAGGLVGALTHAGEREEDAHVYAEGVRRGGTLVSAKVDDSLATQAESVLNGRGVSAAARGGAYREQGWSRFDESAPAFTSDQVVRERTMYTTR